ncbi:Hypothetical predicted protein [Paramuricea clavata]|uniref:Uncharacterized protein n=1 Tax=Paramuricea clavata TaxID=317549 RepID=A0A7D9EPI5_PARCT|nr:Hypothetical predicted protein [Paramuricea clavata]
MPACIKIENNGSVVAVIPAFELTRNLEELRNKIDEDELLEGKFTFTGVTYQEEKDTAVEDVVLFDDEHCESSNKKVVKIQVTSAEECEVNDICTGYTAKTPSSSNDEVEKWKSAFRYQSPWEVKRIKIYSDDEVRKARGMRSEYLKFWNKRVKELCRQIPNASRKKITSQVDEEWRKEQNNILSAEASILEKIGGKSPEGLKPGTLHTNMKAIDDARSDLEATEAMLANKDISAVEKQRLIANQKRARSHLKRAQESMRKNLNAKKQKTD